MRKRTGRPSPLQLLVWGYVGLSVLGALLLMIPWARRGPLSFVDALFTATSALCVTGLIVKDTATFWTPFGKAILLLWIEIGALGYMTFATLILGFLTGKRDLRLRQMMSASFPALSPGYIGQFARRVLLFSILTQTVGWILLALWLWPTRGVRALGEGLFLSISAFGNAGFSPYSDNLVQAGQHAGVLLTVALLLILGGLGFWVIEDLTFYFTGRRRKLTLHTRWVLRLTTLLLLSGTLWILLADWHRGLVTYSPGFRILHAFFQAATPRTAGFNTVDLTHLSPLSLTLIAFLMFVGGSPGGTAGGIKTTTLLTLWTATRAFLRGHDVVLSRRRIPLETVAQATAIVTLAAAVIGGVLTLLLFAEGAHTTIERTFRYFFEVVSAFGTVGLSLGSLQDPRVSFSADFSVPAKSLIILTMWIGRAGILTVAAAFIERRHEPIQYVDGQLLVG